MKIEIKYADLMKSLSNEETKAEALQKYFDFVETSPFAGEYKLKENVILIPDDEDFEGFLGSSIYMEAMNKANSDARKRRDTAFEKAKNDPTRIIVVSEGDSWFQYPKFNLLGVGLTKEVKDIIDYLIDDQQFAVKSLDAGGDIIRNMYHSREYFTEIESNKPKVFLLSAGGNDFFEMFPKMLRKNDTDDITNWLSVNFKTEFSVIKQYYTALLSELVDQFPELQIIIHGYDYIMPQPEGKWIGKPMVDIGIGEAAKRKALIKYIMDEFNLMLAEIPKIPELSKNVHYLDLRGAVPQDKTFWHDEIHPNDHGFKFVAERFKAKLAAIVQSSNVVS